MSNTRKPDTIKYSLLNPATLRLAPLTLAVGGSLAHAGSNTIEVTTLGSAGTPGECTLHDAVAAANNQAAYGNCPAPADDYPTIVFAGGLDGTITKSDSLVISASLRIDGDERIGVELPGDVSGSVLIAEDSVEQLTIDGLSVSGGNAGSGGGLHSQATHLTVRDSVISGNTASNDGGGIYHVSTDNGEVDIRYSEISNNYATLGGGLFLEKTGEGSVTVVSNDFSSNSSSYSGGGAFIIGDQADGVALGYNTFTSNESGGLVPYGAIGAGLAAYLNDGEADFKYNQFLNNQCVDCRGGAVGLVLENQSVSAQLSQYVNNEAFYFGGGLFAQLDDNSYLHIDEAYAYFNETVQFGGAAFIDGDGAEVVINRSEFSANSSGAGGGLQLTGDFERFELRASSMRFNDGDQGGHIRLGTESSEITGEFAIRSSELYYGEGGGIAAHMGDDSDLLVSNSTLAANDGSDLGAINAVGSGTLRVSYSTLSFNYAESGGVGVNSSVPCSVRNSIFANLFNTSPPYSSELAGSSSCSVRHSLISDTTGSTYSNDGGNLLNKSPLLVEFDDHGGYPTQTHRIAPTSPAIAAGHDFGDAPEYDQRGPDFERISGDALDIGAYEFQVGVFQDRFEAP